MTKRLVIALVDDDPAVLDSTRLVLEAQSIVVHGFQSAEDFLAAFDNGHSSLASLACIVSDVRMVGLSGLELQSALQGRGCHIPLILITGHGDVRMAVTALKAGAKDFIEKPFVIESLVAAIHHAATESKATDDLAKLRNEVAARAAQLSVRQREVMELVVEGYSSKQIAAKLAISPQTVETYRLHIMEKMGAGSVAGLVKMDVLLRPQSSKGS
jgi:two-component system, LuxR family, response regulator FixJ